MKGKENADKVLFFGPSLEHGTPACNAMRRIVGR
jgi:hypothetical protein